MGLCGYGWRIQRIVIAASLVFDIMPKLPSTSGEAILFFHVNAVLSLSIVNFNITSLRAIMLLGRWTDWALKVLLHSTPNSGYDSKCLPNSRLSLYWILHEE